MKNTIKTIMLFLTSSITLVCQGQIKNHSSLASFQVGVNTEFGGNIEGLYFDFAAYAEPPVVNFRQNTLGVFVKKNFIIKETKSGISARLGCNWTNFDYDLPYLTYPYNLENRDYYSVNNNYISIDYAISYQRMFQLSKKISISPYLGIGIKNIIFMRTTGYNLSTEDDLMASIPIYDEMGQVHSYEKFKINFKEINNSKHVFLPTLGMNFEYSLPKKASICFFAEYNWALNKAIGIDITNSSSDQNNVDYGSTLTYQMYLKMSKTTLGISYIF